MAIDFSVVSFSPFVCVRSLESLLERLRRRFRHFWCCVLVEAHGVACLRRLLERTVVPGKCECDPSRVQVLSAGVR